MNEPGADEYTQALSPMLMALMQWRDPSELQQASERKRRQPFFRPRLRAAWWWLAKTRAGNVTFWLLLAVGGPLLLMLPAVFSSDRKLGVALVLAVFFAGVFALTWGVLFVPLIWLARRLTSDFPPGAGEGMAQRDTLYGDAKFTLLATEFASPDAVAACLVYQPTREAAMERLVPWRDEDLKLARWTWEQLSRHVLVVGATGSGKTSAVFTHLMASARVPWIYQDQKGDLPLRSHFPHVPLWGLDTKGHVSRSLVWNPLQEVRGPEDVEVISALLFPDRGDMNDWVIRGARLMFEALLKHHRFQSLQAVAWLLEHESMANIVSLLPKGYSSSVEDTRTRSYFTSTLLEILKPWNTARIAQVTLGDSTVTLDDFIDQGGYVLCNEDKHMRQPVTLFWGLLLHRLRNRAAGSAPLLLLMDEFGDAGKIPNMAEALALYRSKGVGIVAGVQSTSLLEAVYGHNEWKAVRDGFGTLVVMTANMPAALRREMTDQLGKWTALVEQHTDSKTGSSFSMGQGGSSINFGHEGSSDATAQRHAVDLVPIDKWSEWGDARACLVRGTFPTWWIPVSMPLDPAPLGPVQVEAAGDWRELEAQRLQLLAQQARVGMGQAPAEPERQLDQAGDRAEEGDKSLFS